MNFFARTGMAAVAVAAVASLSLSGATAQEKLEAVKTIKDWSVFQVDDGRSKLCWTVTSPTKSTARRGGQTVQVRRGDIFLMVAVRPADGVKNEVSFLAGYPFKKGSKVEAKVGSKTFSLFTDGENAWTPTSKDDDQVVAAFRRGSTAMLTGVSSRGTETVDTFSLSGFTAALKHASDLCKQ